MRNGQLFLEGQHHERAIVRYSLVQAVSPADDEYHPARVTAVARREVAGTTVVLRTYAVRFIDGHMIPRGGGFTPLLTGVSSKDLRVPVMAVPGKGGGSSRVERSSGHECEARACVG